MSGRRGWKLDLGDHRGVEAAAATAAKRKKPTPSRGGSSRGKTAHPPGRSQRGAAPSWKPGPGAKRVGIEAGGRLAAFVARMRPGLSGREAKRLIEAGLVRVDGQVETFASRELRSGEHVEVFADLAPQEHVFDPRRVVHDEAEFLAYDKPAWLPVTPTDAAKSWSLLDILRGALGPGIIPVHRLDADTSGLVLFARTERCARLLELAFRDHHVQKTYLAIVRGHPRPTGEHRSYLVQTSKGQGFEHWQSGHGADGREAITTWEVVEKLGAYGALVKVMPKTGRHHQIRIHFAEMGHPLYGDRRHGDRRDPVQAPRHMLHAWKMRLPHPLTSAAMQLTAPKPQEFERLAAELR